MTDNLKTERQRITDAYRELENKTGYQAAPDADTAARGFRAELNSARGFHIGVPTFRTNKALVYVIEAARALCRVDDKLASALLVMAQKEIREATCDD
jgi:hypothetical protein